MDMIIVPIKRKHFVPDIMYAPGTVFSIGTHGIPFESKTKCPLANAIKESLKAVSVHIGYSIGRLYVENRAESMNIRFEGYNPADMLADDLLLDSVTDPEAVIRNVEVVVNP